MSTNNFLDLQYCYIVVDERPFCIWDQDLEKRSLNFLENLDPSYFGYMADVHLQNIGKSDDAKSKESQHAALALRATYSQALETLFALISAGLQAPRCVPAWLYLYTNHELRSVIDKIHNRKHLISQVKMNRLSWTYVSEIVLQCLVIEDKEKETAIKKGFAHLWSRFASDFLDDKFTNEYNSIKHGLRIRPGGFYVAMGLQDHPGSPVPAEKMRLMGKSDFGSSYIATEKIGKLSHHLQMKHHFQNWSPEDMAWGLHMISMSITNVQSALKILNGVNPENIQFHWPSDLSSLLEPWKRSHRIGVTSMSGLTIQIQPDFIDAFPKERILSDYTDGKDAGVRRLFFENPPNNSEKTNTDSSKRADS